MLDVATAQFQGSLICRTKPANVRQPRGTAVPLLARRWEIAVLTTAVIIEWNDI